MKKNFLSVLCMMMLFLFFPNMSVQAAEDSTGKDWEYSYSLYSYMLGSGNVTSTTLEAVLFSDYPVYGYISQDHLDDQGYAVITYAACIPDDVNSNSFTYKVEGTETTLWASGTLQEKQPDLALIGLNYSNWIDSLKDSSQNWGKSVYVGPSYALSFPVFENKEALRRYLESDDESGWLNKPPLDLELNGVLNESFEIPVLSVDSSGYDFTFVNGADNVYFELMGRWWSVDDVEFYKEHLMWKHKYATLLKSDLTTWVSVDNKALSTKKYNLEKLGKDNFDLFLIKNPISLRTFSGGTNAFGNYFSGYNDAVDMFKMQLETPGTMYVGVEVYVRYYTEDEDGNLFYSRWTHYYDNLANPSGSSGSSWDDKDNLFGENQSKVGLTTSEILGLEDKGNSRQDGDLVANYNNYTNFIDDSENLLKSINGVISLLAGSVSLLGSFPDMLAQVFSFLPSWIISFISLSLAVIIILRIVGR